MDKITRQPEILVVDDDATNLRFIKEILSGEYKVFLAPSGSRALMFLKNRRPDLILLDVDMPEMDGYAVIRAIKQVPAWREIPIIFLTGMEGSESEQYAFELGAVDYVLKPITAGILKARAGLHIELESYRRHLEDMVTLRTAQLQHTQDVILDILANMTSFRDNETGAHIKRTTIYAKMIMEYLLYMQHPRFPCDAQLADDIVKSAKLHDIGKVAVPDAILFKPARLTVAEFDVIKQHTVYGAQIIDSAMEELGETAQFLVIAREIILSHHEKWDGSGYPEGLAGEDIPLSARVMAIADVYDALISSRPYKEPCSHEESIGCILRDAGTHFDPHLVELVRDVMEGFRSVAQRHQDAPLYVLIE